MSFRLIAGRAGSGKTHACLDEISSELARSLIEGPRLIMLVPEQAALQMERSLVGRTVSGTLGRCEVLSFRRLAHRILDQLTGPAPTPLTPLGRQMVLRHLINRRRGRMQEFGKVAERSGFLAAIAASVAELFQESVALDHIRAAAERARVEQHPSAPRLHDVALLYEAYLEYLGSQRVDPEGVLDLARDRLGDSPWLEGARVWIDGFAGFTRQQVRMIAELARRADQISLTLLMDPAADGPVVPTSLFARTSRSWAAISAALRECGIAFDVPLLLDPPAMPRFSNRPMLLHLERTLFVESRDAAIDRKEDSSPEISSDETVQLVHADDIRAEVAAATRKIVDLVSSPTRPMRYRDIAVIVRDLEPYHDLISDELNAHRIPFFIDRRRSTFHHPLIQYVRAALALHGDTPFDRSAALLFKTGLSGMSDDEADALENHAIAFGLSSASSWKQPWAIPSSGEEDDEPRPADEREYKWLNAARSKFIEFLGGWLPTARQSKSGAPCRAWTEELSALISRANIAHRLQGWCAAAVGRGDLDEAEEHEQVWNDLHKLLEEMNAALGDEPMSARQYRDCLDSGLSQLTLGLVPATLDQVLVGSIERSRHPPVKAALILGFCEGQFPARAEEDVVFSDEDRGRLEADGIHLSRTRVGRILDERMLAYIAVTRPSEYLWVSCPLSDARGKPLGTSPYWSDLTAVLPQVNLERVDTDAPGSVSTASGLAASLARWAQSDADAPMNRATDATWAALYEWARTREPVQAVLRAAFASLIPSAEATLSPQAARSLWTSPYRTSVTALEELAWCPFKHFLNRGLRLQERARHEVAPTDLGLLYHGVLQQFVNEMIESGTNLREMSSYQIATNLDRLCRIVVPRFAEQNAIAERQRRSMMWRGKHELPPALRGHKNTLGKTKLRPYMTERPFGLDIPGALPALQLDLCDGRVVMLGGRIDRIDVAQSPQGAVGIVFDYKRSFARRLHLNEVYHGLALQLLAYLLVLRDHGETEAGAKIIPGGACYLPLLAGIPRVNDPDDPDETDAESTGEYKPRGLIDFDSFGAIEDGPVSGRSRTFNVFANKDGKPGNINTTDSISQSQLTALLEHVRGKMTDLARQWLDGYIAVAPARVGKRLPCTYCPHRGVCRFEYASRQTRPMSSLARSEVLNLIDKEATAGG